MEENLNLLPVWDTIRAAWDKVNGAKATVWAAVGVVVAVMVFLGLLEYITQDTMPNLFQVISFIGQVIAFLFEMGFLYVGIRRAFDLPIDFRMIFRAFESRIAIRLIAFYILQLIILLIPTVVIAIGVVIYSPDAVITRVLAGILCIIGGVLFIYLTIRMLLCAGYILNDAAGPWQAIKLSFAATRANFWRIIAVLLIEGAIILISMIPLGIGLIWTIPFGFVCFGEIFKRLPVLRK